MPSVHGQFLRKLTRGSGIESLISDRSRYRFGRVAVGGPLVHGPRLDHAQSHLGMDAGGDHVWRGSLYGGLRRGSADQ